MVTWLKTCKIISLFLFWIVVFGLFLPGLTLANSIPYTITTGIPTQNTTWGTTYLKINFDIDYHLGNIVLSGNPDGTGNTAVDDAAMIWVVERPDGTSASTEFRYDNGCAFISAKPPQDVTHLFKEGINKVQVTLYDICGTYIGSSPLYLVNINASRTPLILIPGIGGSELKMAASTTWSKDNGHGGTFTKDYLTDEKIWVNEGEVIKPGDDDYFDVLRMKNDGINSESPIELTNNLVTRAYQGMTDFFISNGYTLNQDLFIFPYDWRLDISHTKPLLDQKIQQIKQQTGTQKVDIVAHSMGGLVSRYYIADPEKAQNIRKLFTLGTPHLGAPKFLKNLQYGDCLALGVGSFCPTIAPLEVKDVLRNMISGYQLAPSQAYFNFYNGSANNPFPYKSNSSFLNYTQIKNLLSTAGYNTALFTPAENFHTLDSTLSNTNGVAVTIIAGSSKPTLGQIIETTRTSLSGQQTVNKDLKVINGDGTVPLLSASVNDPTRNLSSLGNAKIYYTNQEHGNLAANGAALNLVKNVLAEKTELPENVSLQPYPLPLLYRILSVHSPVNIHVYDALDNHTGLTSNGDFETNVPGSSYETLGDAKFIYLPENGTYNIKFEATDQGSFDFKISEYAKDEITKTSLYQDIPLTTTTKAQTTFNTSVNPTPVINIDTDGNGTIDSTSSLTSVQNNLILNGSFETTQNGKLSSWYTSAVNFRDATISKQGTASFKMIPGTELWTGYDYSQQYIKLKPATKYTVTYWAKTENVTGWGIGMRYAQLQPDTQVFWLPWTSGFLNGTKDWTKVTHSFSTPANYQNGRLDIMWQVRSGSAWIDEIALCEGNTCQ